MTDGALFIKYATRKRVSTQNEKGWGYKLCRCGNTFMADKAARCPECRTYYWTQVYDGVEEPIERWEIDNEQS